MAVEHCNNSFEFCYSIAHTPGGYGCGIAGEVSCSTAENRKKIKIFSINLLTRLKTFSIMTIKEGRRPQ
nr:MAG TPA: hypothetical protein [Caudoviricetes sp.]